MLTRDEYQQVSAGLLNAPLKVVDDVPMVNLEVALRIVAAATTPMPTPGIKVIPAGKGEARLEMSIGWPVGEGGTP